MSIFFVKSGSGGNRLLFRYPYDDDLEKLTDSGLSMESTSEQDLAQLRNLIVENDEALCNMFSVNPNLCGQKFEIKINSVRHVGHPMSLLTHVAQPSSSLHCNNKSPANLPHRQPHFNQADSSFSSYDCLAEPKSKRNFISGDITSFNIVFALRASASYDIVDCYHDLSKRLAIALSFEERRCRFLSREIKNILVSLEESDMVNLPHPQEKQNRPRSKTEIGSLHMNGTQQRFEESVFDHILNRSGLAKDLKRIFVSLSKTGIVDLKINNWVSLSFCLPQKAHRLKLMTHRSMPAISTKDIERCLLYLRPYHGLLLLCEPRELLDSLPLDASPAFIQLISVTKPDKNFMDLSVDANLTLMQIYCIVSQLVYWAKANVIYPICDSNIYAIHPLASTSKYSKLVDEFQTRFPNSKSLHHYLADFSEGTSLSQLNGPLLTVEEKLNLLSIVTWLLQRRILTQVHKYVFLVLDSESDRLSNQGDRFSTEESINNEQLQPSPQGIEIRVAKPQVTGMNLSNGGTAKLQSSIPNNSVDSHPFKNSLAESFESSLKYRSRTDSFPESQEDSNFGLNSSLSSTPNSNLDYPSPGNDLNNRSSLSSSFNLDNSINGLEGSGTALAALKRAGLSLSGAKSVLSIPSSKNPDDLKLLVHLLPYFDGKHHIEDIMFFGNLERSQVLILCDKFRDILYTCHYEDVAVSQLSPFTSTR